MEQQTDQWANNLAETMIKQPQIRFIPLTKPRSGAALVKCWLCGENSAWKRIKLRFVPNASAPETDVHFYCDFHALQLQQPRARSTR
jgi:hypothetical protein